MNHIINRIYFKGTLEAKSPFMIGAYDDDFVDMVCMKDEDNNPMIPGTSIAGVLKRLFSNLDEELLKKIFGYTEENSSDSRQSNLITYDCFMQKNSKINYEIRDGIKINYDTKITEDKAKYDYEVVSSGCKLDFKLELVIRSGDKDKKEDLLKLFNYMIKIIEDKILIGGKTNRGFGEFSLTDCKVYEIYEKDYYNKYVNFDWDKDFVDYKKSSIYKAGVYKNLKPKYERYEFKAYFPYTLVVRTTDVIDVKNKFEMLKSNRKPVIPGTTWSGVFKNAAYKLLKQLGITDTEYYLEKIFGTSEDKKHDEKVASNIMFNESIITKCKEFSQTHVKIDRFTQSAVDTALVKGGVIADATCNLTITLKESKPWIKQLLNLIIQDINDGYITLGGQTAIGRGIFKLEEETPDILAIDDYKELYQKLKKKLKEGVTKHE